MLLLFDLSEYHRPGSNILCLSHNFTLSILDSINLDDIVIGTSAHIDTNLFAKRNKAHKS